MYFVAITGKFNSLDVPMPKQAKRFVANVLIIFVGLVVFGFSFNEVRYHILHIKSRHAVFGIG